MNDENYLAEVFAQFSGHTNLHYAEVDFLQTCVNSVKEVYHRELVTLGVKQKEIASLALLAPQWEAHLGYLQHNLGHQAGVLSNMFYEISTLAKAHDTTGSAIVHDAARVEREALALVYSQSGVIDGNYKNFFRTKHHDQFVRAREILSKWCPSEDTLPAFVIPDWYN